MVRYLWGTHKVKAIQYNNFDLNIVLLDEDRQVKEMMEDIFTKVLEIYLDIFPNTPKSAYLITVFQADQNDGEAYDNSNAFTIKTALSDKNKSIWANLFAHELFHFWNGGMIYGADESKTQWFSEGFTEYFANLTLVRAGILSEEAFFRMIEKTIGLHYYFRYYQYPEVSLVAAGTKESKYRFGVYNGGWCAAFVMDIMLREKYPDKSLADFMNIIFEKYGLTKQNFLYEDLINEFTEFSGEDSSSFFSSYINGAKTLPIEKYLGKMGIVLDDTSYDGTAFLYYNQNASPEEIELRN